MPLARSSVSLPGTTLVLGAAEPLLLSRPRGVSPKGPTCLRFISAAKLDLRHRQLKAGLEGLIRVTALSVSARPGMIGNRRLTDPVNKDVVLG